MNSTYPKRLFVYGTLRHDVEGGPPEVGDPLGLGTIQARLFKVASYPGAVPTDEAECTEGQLLSFQDLSDTEWVEQLDQLDWYEGIKNGLFRRERIEVSMEDGDEFKAWVYYFNRPTEGLKPIPSGDWTDQ